VRYYPGELHAFHALLFRPAARQCWAAAYRFLERHVPPR
jgi:acetyl esterase